MAGMLWITDREPGIRALFSDLLPEGELLSPDEVDARLRSGQRPDAVVIDGTQLLELAASHRRTLLGCPRVLVCTGLPLWSLPMSIVAGPSVAVLAKPFCVEDLEAALQWVRDLPSNAPSDGVAFGALVQRRRRRSTRGGLPAR